MDLCSYKLALLHTKHVWRTTFYFIFSIFQPDELGTPTDTGGSGQETRKESNEQ